MINIDTRPIDKQLREIRNKKRKEFQECMQGKRPLIITKRKGFLQKGKEFYSHEIFNDDVYQRDKYTFIEGRGFDLNDLTFDSTGTTARMIQECENEIKKIQQKKQRLLKKYYNTFKSLAKPEIKRID